VDITLVGADFEENLGVGMIAAALKAAGHSVEVVAFGDASDCEQVSACVRRRRPDVVGLSIQFQHRAGDFLGLARFLRRCGYQGHITCGGQFPTMAWREVLDGNAGLDSVVLGDGERTVVDLVDAIASGRPLADVAGLALAGGAGASIRTAPRAPDGDLDALPFPLRYRPHARHCGIPFIPILGGRGCWGACRFCSISAVGRAARTAGGGRTFRLRTVDNLAAEMALLWHRAGGAAIFCFHDDNLLLPRPEATLARMRSLRAALDGYGVGNIGFVGKCRPETLTPELAQALAALGAIRLYVGVENASEAGGRHLGRAVQTPHIHAAIDACNRAGINACYNLLVFEPEATLDDLRANLAFIRSHPGNPVNFCRAEPYLGTPLHTALSATGRLEGDHLAWGYRIEDDRTELAFRIAAAVFRQRNFDAAGVANRTMGLQYAARILERFYAERDGTRAALIARCAELTRQISLETADFFEEVLDIATASAGDAERTLRETALLGLRLLRADQERHQAMDDLYGAIEAFACGAPARAQVSHSSSRLGEHVRTAALGASLALSVVGCRQRHPDRLVPASEASPADAAPRQAVPATLPPPVCDPLPPDPDLPRAHKQPEPKTVPAGVARRKHRRTAPHHGPLALPPDPPPPPPDRPGSWSDDPPPPPPVCDPVPPDPRFPMNEDLPHESVVGHFRDVGAGFLRSTDLPLWGPPVVRLDATAERAGLRVRLVGAPAAVSVRWEGDGSVVGAGCEVLWKPGLTPGWLRVAVRAHGGVAFASLRWRGEV
jgi:anaerobic magnesium-protoporphyrin IX monomethyl ester cyclase